MKYHFLKCCISIEYELRLKQTDSEENNEKSRHELSIRKFTETLIRFVMQGIEFKITQSGLAKLTRCENIGMFETGTIEKSSYASHIKDKLFSSRSSSSA